MGDMSTQSKSHLGDGGCGSVKVGLSQGREGLGSRVTRWDEDHTRMTHTSDIHVPRACPRLWRLGQTRRLWHRGNSCITNDPKADRIVFATARSGR